MNLSIPDTVKQFSIEKKYYKKYFYKIVIKVVDSAKRPGFRELYDARQNLIKQIAELPIEDAECKIRGETKWLSVFTNDSKFIELLFTNFYHQIVEYHRPINDQHKSVIDESRRIRVRKQLFETQFKFKVYFTQDLKDGVDRYVDVNKWVNSLDNVNGDRWAVNSTLRQYFGGRWWHPGYTAAIYLNDPEDLMMCQLRFHKEIHYIEEAVLLSSL